MKNSSKTDKAKLMKMKEPEIDYSDIPKTDADFWDDAEVIFPKKKTHLQ